MFQAGLLDLLSVYGVKTPEDFYRLPPGQGTYFIRRLYGIFKANHGEALRDLASAGGVKFHFATSGDLSQSNTNLPTPAFLKKLCFYSNRTLVTFPFRELKHAGRSRALRGVPAKTWRKSTLRENSPLIFGRVHTRRTPVGSVITAAGKSYALDPAAFRDFLSVISQLQPALRSGMAYLLPTFPDNAREFRGMSLRLTPANFKLEELRRQFAEEELAQSARCQFRGDLLNLYLPYFTDISLERILEIRDRQQTMYNDFQRYLENLLYGLSEAEAERRLLTFLREVDEGIRELDKKFRSIQTDYRRKNIYARIGVLSTGLAIFAGLEFAREVGQMVSAALGGATAMQLLSTRGEGKKAMGVVAADRFYLPWLIQKEAERVGGR